MTAAVLREAAALMRERAQTATPGPWSNRRGPGEDVVRTETGTPLARTSTRADRRHIASWHPVVALKVAKALEQAAAILDEADSGPLAMAMNAIAEPLVEVARAYLATP